MSADLFSSQIDDDKYGTLCLEMTVDGQLRIIAYDPGNRDLVGCFQLPPSKEGFTEASRLIDALNEWINHNRNPCCDVNVNNDVLPRPSPMLYLTPPSNTCVVCKERFWSSMPGRDICAACYAHRESQE